MLGCSNYPYLSLYFVTSILVSTCLYKVLMRVAVDIKVEVTIICPLCLLNQAYEQMSFCFRTSNRSSFRFSNIEKLDKLLFPGSVTSKPAVTGSVKLQTSPAAEKQTTHHSLILIKQVQVKTG